jgi:DNA repair protein RadD
VSQAALNFAAPGAGPLLRPYQTEGIDRIESTLASEVRAVLAVAPTGSGKTVIAAELIRRRPEQTILFLAPRRELIHQTCNKLHDVGVHHGVILAGDKRSDSMARVQVASVDTLIARMLRSDKVKLENVALIIMDEAHIGLTERRQELLTRFPGAKIIGLTATPCRGDGKALGAVYDELVEITNPADLTHDGYLCKARYFSVANPDLRGVRTTAGDYNGRDLEGVMNRPQLVGDIVSHWLKHAGGRRTVVFATSIAHSAALAQEFLNAGVAAEHVDANTTHDDRKAIFERFSNGQTQVLSNCTLASVGFDLPELDCVVFGRPTKSVALYLQMLGRGLRPAPGKSDCLVLDHAGNVHRHGFATDERFWTLHGKYAIDQAKQEAEKAEREERDEVDMECPECKALWRGGGLCPECGWTPPPKQKPVETLDGELIELGQHDTISDAKRLRFYMELVGLAEQKGWKPGFAAYKYRERFGDWPKREWNRYGGVEPRWETIRWVQSQQRKFFRRQNQERARANDGPIIP